MVLLDFVCLKKCGELHFGQERGLAHSPVVLGDKDPRGSRISPDFVVPTSVGLHIEPLSQVVPVSRAVYGIQFREGECVSFETIRRFPLQLCRANDVTGRGVSYLRGNSTEFKKAVRYDFESLAIFGIVNKERLFRRSRSRRFPFLVPSDGSRPSRCGDRP